MRIVLSLSNANKSNQPMPEFMRKLVDDKLAQIINTINGLGSLNPNRCYGTVAYKLKEVWDDSWWICFFGTHGLDHCCLFDNDGNVVADSFKGRIEHGVYLRPDGELYPRITEISLADIRRKIHRFRK